MTVRTKPVAIISTLVFLLAVLPFTTNPATAQSTLAKPILTATLRSPYVGAGFTIQQENGQFKVIRVYPGSPADTAGFLSNDVFVTIGGVSLEGKTEEQFGSLIPQEAGTVVSFEVRRPNVQNLVSISVAIGNVVPDEAGISWAEIEGAAHYELWEWEEEQGWMRLSIDDEENLIGTDYFFWGRKPGGTYYYTVRAVNATGHSEWSDYSDVTYSVVQAAATPTPIPTSTSAATTTAEPTVTATATPASIENCTLVEYSLDDLLYPTISIPLIQNETFLAYRTKYGENIDRLEIVEVLWYADGAVGILYFEPLKVRMVFEWFRGCEFVGHSGWFDLDDDESEDAISESMRKTIRQR